MLQDSLNYVTIPLFRRGKYEIRRMAHLLQNLYVTIHQNLHLLFFLLSGSSNIAIFSVRLITDLPCKLYEMLFQFLEKLLKCQLLNFLG